jgi:hypothetical protein
MHVEKKGNANAKPEMSELERTWAWFFRLAGWQWLYKPSINERWQPTFYVCFDCSHSECSGCHELYVLVSGQESACDPELLQDLGLVDSTYGEPCPAIFGRNPSATRWYMGHGSGGGMYDVSDWVDNSDELWTEAVKRNSADLKFLSLLRELGCSDRVIPETCSQVVNGIRCLNYPAGHYKVFHRQHGLGIISPCQAHLSVMETIQKN